MLKLFYIILMISMACVVPEISLGGGLSSDQVAEQEAKSKPDLRPDPKGNLFEAALEKYSHSKGLQMRVERKVKLSLLGDKKEHSGRLYLSAGKMRMDLKGDDPIKLIMDENNIWYETTLADFNNQIQVSKMNARQAQKSNAFLAVLFNPSSSKEHFKIKDQKRLNKLIVYSLQPSTKLNTEIVRLEMAIEPESREIRIVKYWDELENETSYEFSDVEKLKEDHQLFSYSLPKGAELVDYTNAE